MGPARLGNSQRGAERLDAARLGAGGQEAAHGVDLHLQTQVACTQPCRAARRGLPIARLDGQALAAPTAGQQGSRRVGQPLALRAQGQAAAVASGAEQRVGPGWRPQGALHVQGQAVLGQGAVQLQLQAVRAQCVGAELLGVDLKRQRRARVGPGAALRTQTRGLPCAHAQVLGIERAVGAECGPAALRLKLRFDLAGQGRCAHATDRATQREQRLQRRQRRRLDVDTPAVVAAARREPALQRRAVAGGAQIGIDGPARSVAVEADRTLQRHARKHAVAQLGLGLPTPCEPCGQARQRRVGAALQIGLPVAGHSVLSLAQGTAGRTRQPQRRVEGLELALAAQVPGIGCTVFNADTGVGPCIAVACTDVAQLDAPGVAAALRVCLRGQRHRFRAAHVDATVERNLRLQRLPGSRAH